jgi:hypothetical protein
MRATEAKKVAEPEEPRASAKRNPDVAPEAGTQRPAQSESGRARIRAAARKDRTLASGISLGIKDLKGAGGGASAWKKQSAGANPSHPAVTALRAGLVDMIGLADPVAEGGLKLHSEL